MNARPNVASRVAWPPNRAGRIVEHRWFEGFIIAVIVVNAVVLGIETSADIMSRYGSMLRGLNAVFQAIFVAELALRLAAYWPRPAGFFRNGWNLFDFVIVVGSLVPMGGAWAGVGRLLRLARITRLVSVSPGLRLIVATMLASIPSIGHVLMMLSLLLYVYAILGVQFFHEVDPQNWGNLGAAALSLFQMITLEGWADLQAAVLPAKPWAWLYFASFIITAVFVVMNLFIAVVINNLESVKHEDRAATESQDGHSALLGQIARLRGELDSLEQLARRANGESR